ncbi:hypothetical protein RN001_006261 [Aquatica leii]|uniref:THAP-type domain-containing protein n=1 Tax=Aquatica leii TaxID=1421715 RepID=A0AAN7PD70_9COLE|nr:hypothetical protein RN001_006261 [Aquatica leii]
MKICSDHFLSGKPAPLGNVNNPDYVPHLKMGYKTNKSSSHAAAQRYARAKRREVKPFKIASKKVTAHNQIIKLAINKPTTKFVSY